MKKVFVGRQPILNRRLEVHAYELLFRSGQEASSRIGNGDLATTEVMLNTFCDIGLDQLVTQHLAFINLPRAFLTGSLPLPFAPGRVVLEILEDIEDDPEIIQAVKALKVQGYIVALDDYTGSIGKQALIGLADIIKVDLQLLPRANWRETVEELRAIKPGLLLLAEKVESKEEYLYCRQLGFHYFQGYFFCRPEVVEGRRLSGNRLAMLNLMAELQNPEADMGNLENLIIRDVSLSYRLLRYINSAAFGLQRNIESIRQMLVMLGMDRIRNWVCLILMADVEDKPRELLTLSMIRGKMCEQLAVDLQFAGKEQFFTVGLFSLLDAIMDRPLVEVIDSLPLAGSVTNALLRHEGHAGAVLQLVKQFETGDWEPVSGLEQLTPGVVTQAWISALRWADESSAALS